MAEPVLHALPPGVDFAGELAAGLIARHGTDDPAALARVDLLVNTSRMGRTVRAALLARGVRLLPRIRLIEDLARDTPMAGLAVAVPPLRRRLEAAALVARLLDTRPDIAPRASLFDLAGSLADLMAEMHGEGVGPEALEGLGSGDLAIHWERALAFVRIVQGYFDSMDAPDGAQRLRAVTARLAEEWTAAGAPPRPTVIAGSTGSRGATALLMRALAPLPGGAVVLPGFDFDLPARVWSAMDDPLTGEDHPQYRFRRLMDEMGVGPEAVGRWTDARPPAPARAALVSLALRPAPVTDAWLREGPGLPPLADALGTVTVVEAPSPRAEALAIALGLRQAAEEGRRAALITPDRALGRQVTAALARWGIVPDDSAGEPLHQSPPGRLLRQVARLRVRPPDVEAVLALLKHPLAHSGAGRGDHLRRTRELELELRRSGPPHPARGDLARWAEARERDEGCGGWCDWLADLLEAAQTPAAAPAEHAAAHLALAERLAAGHEAEGAGDLWDKEAGETARAAMDALLAEAAHGAPMDAADYAALADDVLSAEEVRRSEIVRPGILIWGTLEARTGGLDLAILGGLTEGIWPPAPPADPWLNRDMRHRAGLTLPERRTGLAAHDFQQAACAPEVWLTRAARDLEAETVPSRWLNRVANLARGLPAGGGPEAFAAARARGDAWLAVADALERPPEPVEPARRPAPAPPAAVRPRRWSPSSLRTLRRDPYAVYARHVLGLRRLDPVRPEPTALQRGEALHLAFERFVFEPGPRDPARLLAIAEEVLEERVPWPAARRLWLGRLARVADWFVSTEAERLLRGTPLAREAKGEMPIPAAEPMVLAARADRIDRAPDGRLILYDYKTGAPPSPPQQVAFDRQLLLGAMMAEAGAFAGVPAAPVAHAAFVGAGTSPKVVPAPLEDVPAARVMEELVALLNRYLDPGLGYVSRLAMERERFAGDYDHLARAGEWDPAEPAAPAPVG